MKKVIILLSSLILASCGVSTNPTPSPTQSATVSPSPALTVKYTREDYIRILTCTNESIKALPQAQFKLSENLRDFARTAGHLSLLKNDTVWEQQKNNTSTYDEDIATISSKYPNCK